tara:strand:- start:542 stop:910 length:369 start_codon:yes stop_codon:yes gene_type:complete
MASFPAITPTSRTYVPGTFASSALPSLTGDETNIRHSNASVGHRLRMSFINITRAQHFELVSHYSLHGTFETFDITATTLKGTNLTFPTNYKWRYRNRPNVEETPTQIDFDVELELLPPYVI